MKKHTFLIPAVVAFVLLFALVVIPIAKREFNKQLAQKSDLASISKSMSHEEVVEILGVLYDSHSIGEYDDIDRIAEKIDKENQIDYVCYWRLSDSKQTFWVGFDSQRRVVSTLLQ